MVRSHLVHRALILAGLLALSLFAFAGTASAGSTHNLQMYKVEGHIDLEGEFPNNSFHEHLFCNSGDYAVDGMWRIDHVDQANPQIGIFGDERDVQIDASYGDDVDAAKWHFRGVNNADGRAQVKLWITCISGKTAVDGHQHTLKLSTRQNDPHNGLAPGWQDFTHPNDCPNGSIPVAPGFNFTSGSGRIFRNYPSQPNDASWYWAFLVNGPSANLTLYKRCLTIKLNSAGGPPAHAHNIVYKWLPDNDGEQRFLDPGITEQKMSCGAYGNGAYDQYKGLVAGWWIDDPFHVWFLGMDPRIKERAFKFWNDGGGANTIGLALLCVQDRTGKQIAP